MLFSLSAIRLNLESGSDEDPNASFYKVSSVQFIFFISMLYKAAYLRIRLVRNTCIGKGSEKNCSIHEKKDFCGGDGYFGKKKLAEKVRKSRQNLA